MITISYLFFLIISFFSTYGYGQTFFSNKNALINFIFGIIILTALGFISHILNIKSPWVNIIIIFIGLALFLLKNKIKDFYLSILVICFTFCGILISKPHEDWGYHFNFVEYVSLGKPILGVANIDFHYANASILSYAQKIFFLPFVNFNFINIPTFLVFSFVTYYLIEKLFNLKNFNFFIYTILFIIIIKFTRFSEFGYDFISNLFLISIFLLIFLEKEFKSKSLIILIFFIFAISTKVTAIFFFPIILYALYKSFNLKIFFHKENYKELFFLIFLILLILIDNIIRTGCILFFLKFTCINNDLVFWGVNIEDYNQFSKKIILWAKSYFHQKNIILNEQTFLANFNWVPNWINVHFFYKVFEFILVCAIVPIILFFWNFKNISFIKLKREKDKIILILLMLLSIFLWFIFLPQLRFSTASIIILFALTTKFMNCEKIRLNKISKILLIALPLIFYFGKNLNRIKNEFNRTDAFKFLNFPFLPKDQIPYKVNYSGINLGNLNYLEKKNFIIIKKTN